MAAHDAVESMPTFRGIRKVDRAHLADGTGQVRCLVGESIL